MIDLKSNMDRFIETSKKFFIQQTKYLKSNMDRFIDALYIILSEVIFLFKIQYG